MRVLISFILLISVAATRAAHLQGEAYWHEKLPTTPIPQTLRELISPDDEKVAMNVHKGGVRELISPDDEEVAVSAPRKVGTHGEGVGVSLKRCVVAIIYAATKPMSTDPSLCMFLMEKDLVSGTRLTLSFVQESIPNAEKKHFLPRALADEIPFSSNKLSVALEELNIAPDSVTALAMKETLQRCEKPPMNGESKFCATSLESMIDYITSKMGSSDVTVLATNVSRTSKPVKQEYTIMEVKYEGKAEKPVYFCHIAQYAYPVYQCHDFQGSRTARVWVKGEDGSRVEAVAVCHTDTSAWSPNNLAFQVLHVKPGAGTICHFALQGDVFWVTAA